MSDETTPFIAGDAIASELERYPRRRRWRRKKQGPPLTHCENCGASLVGPYCAQCGQAAVDYRRSFASLLVDAADAFFNFDERFLQTFGLLLIKPWRLTNEFVEGKRARHVHPLRVYLIASVIFFLVINFLARGAHFQAAPNPAGKKNGSKKSGAQTQAAAPSQNAPPIFIVTTSPTPTPTPRLESGPLVLRPTASPKPKKEGVFFEFDDEKTETPFGAWVEKRAKEKLGSTGDRSDLFLKALIQNLAPMVLCCIPLFALVLKILYIFKKRFYIEHLVFALHTHAFVFLSTVLIIGTGFLLAWKAPKPFTPIVCFFLSVAVVVELLFAIRRVYRQNWFATLFKFGLGTAIYAVLLAIAFVITAAVTLLVP